MDLCTQWNQHFHIRAMNFDHVFPGISQKRQSLSNRSYSEGTSHRSLSAQNPTLTHQFPAESNSDKCLLQNIKDNVTHHLRFNAQGSLKSKDFAKGRMLNLSPNSGS